MLRVRVTLLEQFRLLEETGHGDEAALVRALQGRPDPPNELMRRGTAWHALLAGAPLEDPSCHYTPEDVLLAASGLLRGHHELAAEAQVGPLDVVGHCDWVRGLLIQDHKAKWCTPDPRDYERSLQWRFYLYLFDCQVFQYNLWHFRAPDRDQVCHLQGCLSFRLCRYPGMEDELRDWCIRFAAWAQPHLENAT